MKKVNKQEMELRAGFAADLLVQGHSCTVVMTQVIEEYQLSRRQTRRISSKAMDLIVQDFEEATNGRKTDRNSRTRYVKSTGS